MGQRLAGCLRANDTIARFGGDEFMILAEDVADPAAAGELAARVLETLRTPFRLAEQEVFVTASIGLARSMPGAADPMDLLRQADVAMYRAKAAGRETFVLFDPSMNVGSRERLELEAQLRRAVERKELRLYYQPIVELRTGAVVGAEALLRWEHPQRGLISPGAFIPMAEETGIILPIGRWVLEQACKQAQAWQTLPSRAGSAPLRVSVNLSARQFQQPDLVEQVQQVLDATGHPPQYLKLEITESAVMQDG
ncbi:MAG: putative bifunctional diguanylate cyclase/phosphodiesterase [Dehalococcoidia bacterium]